MSILAQHRLVSLIYNLQAMKIFILTLASLFYLQTITAQCYPDRHNTSVYDSWVSVEKKSNPNTIRGNSHWIMYDLGSTYYLGQTYFWNLNDPDRLGDGMQNFYVDVSSDGNNWRPLGEFTIPQASGETTYQGESGPDLGGEKAKFLLITIVDTYSDGVQAGFSEMKIQLESAALAINLIDFNVRCSVDNIPELQWSAIADSSSEYFVIERSLNEVDWEQITEVPVTQLNQEENYSYQAQNTEENYIYRLSSVNQDGDVQFLKLATTECKKARSVDIWPNPFTTNAVVRLNGFAQKNISYQVHDMLGRLATSDQLKIDTDDQTFNIGNEGLSSGQYVLTIDDGFQIYRKTIMYLARN